MRLKIKASAISSGTGASAAVIKNVQIVPNTEDLFWEKVDKANGPTILDTQCWVWTGAKDSDGYGVFAVKRKLEGAHRYGFKLQNGPIPRGHFVMHRCDNPPCVRGEHLGSGTNEENLKDMAQKGRARGGRRTKDGREPKNRRQDIPS